MSLIKGRILKRFYSLHISKRYSASVPAVVSDEALPLYPPILDATYEGRLRNERQLFYDRVKSLSSVEEKLYEITARQNPKSRVYCLSSVSTTPNCVPFQQYVTRTHLIQGLPEKITTIAVDELYDELKPYLCRVIESQLAERCKDERCYEERVIYEITSLVHKKLSFKRDFLCDSVFDFRPRISSYWWHGGFDSKRKKIDEENLCFQYRGQAKYAVRTKHPLPPIISLDDPLCSSPDVINYNYHPTSAALHFKRRYNINSTPGYWPGDTCEYPFVSFYLMDKIKEVKQNVDHLATMYPTFEDGFGIMSSFGWLTSVAAYQGFTPFHDVTYPLVTQTVLTDGQDWCFFVYQLNTMSFHNDVDLKNKRNICWSSGKLRLFETIEDGKLKGVDDSVLKVLLKFFLNSPEVAIGINLKPYLSSTPTKSANEFQVMKEELLKMYSNRPDPHRHKYEVPMWQHIYKWHKNAPPSPYIKLK